MSALVSSCWIRRSFRLRVSLCSHGWPGTYCVGQADLSTEVHLSPPSESEFKDVLYHRGTELTLETKSPHFRLADSGNWPLNTVMEPDVISLCAVTPGRWWSFNLHSSQVLSNKGGPSSVSSIQIYFKDLQFRFYSVNYNLIIILILLFKFFYPWGFLFAEKYEVFETYPCCRLLWGLVISPRIWLLVLWNAASACR